MKIKFKEMDIELSLEAKAIPSEVAKDVIDLFYNSILPRLADKYMPLPSKVKEPIKIPSFMQPQTERPVFRDRLPNNVVNLEELTVKQAVTEKALVRCPRCGQSHCVAVSADNKVYVLEKDFHAQEFVVIAEFDSFSSNGLISMCYKPNMDKFDYFTDLQSVNALTNKDFVVENHSEMFCPVCCESNSFIRWKEAYQKPIEFFEVENVCDVCGGDIIEKVSKQETIQQCECCGALRDNHLSLPYKKS